MIPAVRTVGARDRDAIRAIARAVERGMPEVRRVEAFTADGIVRLCFARDRRGKMRPVRVRHLHED